MDLLVAKNHLSTKKTESPLLQKIQFLSIRLLALLGLMISSCDTQGPKLYTEKPGKRLFSKPEVLDAVSWEQVSKKVFVPRCQSCHYHSDDVKIISFEGAKAAEEMIRKRVLEQKNMPPVRLGPLTAEENEILIAWYEAGSPFLARKPKGENPSPSPTPPTPTPPNPTPTPPVQPPVDSTPTPPPVDGTPTPNPTPSPTPVVDPLLPTFASINQKIIQTRCLECHSEFANAEALPMENLQQLLDPQLKLIVPGNPEESRFIKSVLPGASKRMPPPRSGLQPLSREEISIVTDWVRAGAKD